MELRNLKENDWFLNWDGKIGRLVLLNECRAKIVMEGESKNISPATPIDHKLSSEEIKHLTAEQAAIRPGGNMDTEKIVVRKGAIYGLSKTSVISWMGKNGFDFGETLYTLKAIKVSPMPTDACIKKFLRLGKTGENEPATLTGEQKQELEKHAKLAPKEETPKKADKPVKPAKTPKAEKKSKKVAKKKPAKKPDLKFSKKAQTASKPKKSLTEMAKELTKEVA